MWNTCWLKLSKHGDLLRFSILTSLYIQYFSVWGGCGLDKTFEVFFFYFLELYWLNNYFISWENIRLFGCWGPQSPLFIVTYFSLTYPSLWYWGFRLSILLVKLMYSFPCPALGSSIYCTRQSHLEEVLWFFVCMCVRERKRVRDWGKLCFSSVGRFQTASGELLKKIVMSVFKSKLNHYCTLLPPPLLFLPSLLLVFGDTWWYLSLLPPGLTLSFSPLNM